MSASLSSVEWLEGVRLSVHVLAACVWVGGQIVLAGLVPTIRNTSRDALPSIARAFARLAWPAFTILVVTGVWNTWMYELDSASTTLLAVVFIKVALVAVAGISTAIHSNTSKVSLRTIGGALALVASVFALYLGVVMTVSN